MTDSSIARHIRIENTPSGYEATQDDWCQRLKENPPEPEFSPEQMEAIRQQHEPFLTQLEALAVKAIAIGYWDEVYDHISFFAPETEE